MENGLDESICINKYTQDIACGWWVGHEVEQYKIERLSEDIYLYDNRATNCESTSRTHERYAEDCE
jgi:hypothetical protein